jgi:hypothetical protein
MTSVMNDVAVLKYNHPHWKKIEKTIAQVQGLYLNCLYILLTHVESAYPFKFTTPIIQNTINSSKALFTPLR